MRDDVTQEKNEKEKQVKDLEDKVRKFTKERKLYLEQVGMKGVRVGGAMVAEEHANWILNVDNATSSDVKKLIAIGQKRVLEEFGIPLRREVIYLPEDTEEWT